MFFSLYLSNLNGEFIKLFSEDIFTSGCMPQPKNYNPARGETPTYIKNRSRQSSGGLGDKSEIYYLNSYTGGTGSNASNSNNNTTFSGINFMSNGANSLEGGFGNNNHFRNLNSYSDTSGSLKGGAGKFRDRKSLYGDGIMYGSGESGLAPKKSHNNFLGVICDSETINRAFYNSSGKVSYISRMHSNSGSFSDFGNENNLYNFEGRPRVCSLAGQHISQHISPNSDTSIIASLRNQSLGHNRGASAYARESDAFSRNAAYYPRTLASQENVADAFGGPIKTFVGASDGEGVGSGDLPGAEYGGGYDARGVGIPINGSGVCPLSGTAAANAVNWNLEFKTDGEIIIHYPTSDNNNVWSVGGNGILYMASNHGGIDQGMMFRRLSPGKYQIVSNSQMCVTYIPARERFEMQRCHDTQFQEFAITYDLNGGNCCAYEIYQWIVTPFGRYRKEYDSKKHHRVGDRQHPLNGYYFNYSNAGLNELNREINMMASIVNAQNDLAQW